MRPASKAKLGHDPKEDLHGRRLRDREDQPRPAVRLLEVLREVPLHGRREDRPQGGCTSPATQVNLLLWDLAGEDALPAVQASYLRGSSGIFFVVDGTRRETLTGLAGLQDAGRGHVGDVPAVIAINKADLGGPVADRPGSDIRALSGERRLVLKTSAKTGARRQRSVPLARGPDAEGLTGVTCPTSAACRLARCRTSRSTSSG